MQRPATLVLLCAELTIWVGVSIWETNPSILVTHLIVLALALCVLSSVGRAAAFPFAVALALRSVFTALAWYTAHDTDRRFYIGTNSDASRFWEASLLDYADASLTFEDPLFPRLNVMVTQWSDLFGSAAYLATTQTVLMAGALTVVFAYLFTREHYGPRVARWTAFLLAMSPTAITYSTGLMRDALIGLFGMALLWALGRIKTRPRIATMLCLLLFSVLCLVALNYLRSISLAGFLIAGVILLLSGTPNRPDLLSRRTKLSVLLLLASLLTLAILDRVDRFEGLLDYAITVRAGEGFTDGMDLNPDGLTTRIAEISPALFVLISPTVLMQPIPFFAWDAPEFIGGPPALMDVVQGFGGLFNQVLFGFFLLGIRHWLATRDTLGFRLGVIFTLLLCTFTLVGLGQIRMVMAHCYVFFFAGIALSVDHMYRHRPVAIAYSLVAWLGCLLAMYLAYLAYREGLGLFVAMPMAALAVAALVLLWRQYPRLPGAPAARQQGRRRVIAAIPATNP